MPRFAERKRALLGAMTRDILAREAAALLREEGWGGLTMERLASRVGRAKGTVYNYFQDKGEIVRFLIRRDEERLEAELAGLHLEEREPAEALRLALEVLMRDLYTNRQIISAMIRSEDGMTFPAKAPCGVPKEGRPLGGIREVFLSLVERGIARGDFRASDPALMEAYLHAVVMGVFWQLCVGSLRSDEGTLIRTVTEMALEGICAGRREG